VAVCIASSAARAQEAPSRSLASQEFKRGVTLANNGDLAQAVEAFQNAYRASPHHAALYNLGQAYVGLGRPVEAVETFQRYLQEGGTKSAPERRREVEALLLRQRERIGFIELTVSPEDAEVFVDGKSLGLGPLPKALPLVTGQHVVAARKESYSPHFETVEVA